MEEDKIEIIDDNNNISNKVEESSTSLNMNDIQIIDDAKTIEKKEENKKVKIREKEKEKVTSNVYENKEVNIVETAVTKGASGSVVIGSVEGENVVANNSAMPSPIDITIKKKVDNKNKVKKVKVLTKKEKILGILLRVFVVLVMGAGIYAGYYFGYKTNPSIFEVKTIYLELGDEVPSSVSFYLNKALEVDDMVYTVDLSEVSKDTVGTYPYSVSHGSSKKTGQIIIRDTKAPELIIKEADKLVFMKDSKIEKEDIVESCNDISNCTYVLDSQIYTEDAGEKNVKIIARDEEGNEVVKEVTIKVIDISKTIVCTSAITKQEDKTIEQIDTLNFDKNDYLVKKVSVTRYTYTDNYKEYFDLYTEKLKDEDYTFDRAALSYDKIRKDDDNNLTAFNDLVKYYVEKGYTCK